MKFTEKHLQYVNQLIELLPKASLPDGRGDEYLKFAHSYYFLLDLRELVVESLKAQKAMASAATPPLEPITTSKKTTKNTSKKTKEASKDK